LEHLANLGPKVEHNQMQLAEIINNQLQAYSLELVIDQLIVKNQEKKNLWQ
jgi:hypothetical protein